MELNNRADAAGDEEERNNKRIMELRRSFDELKDKLGYLRTEWMEAHARKDVDRETELINRETQLFNEVNDVITEFSHLMRRHGLVT